MPRLLMDGGTFGHVAMREAHYQLVLCSNSVLFAYNYSFSLLEGGRCLTHSNEWGVNIFRSDELRVLFVENIVYANQRVDFC